MIDYKVELNKIIKDGVEGKQKTEIWANITNLNTNESMDKLIFWKDDNGVLHDETPNLPTEVRDKIDNLWIEKKRIW
jgi:hypothetical protein